MKKRHLVLGLMLIAITGIASAQNTPTAESTQQRAKSPWSVGITGGFCTNTPSIQVPDYASYITYKSGDGATVGITGRYQIAKWLAARASMVWIQKNYKMDRMGYNGSNIINTNYTNNYISLPLAVQVQVGYPFRLFAFAGGYVGYWLSGHRSGNTFTMNYLLYGDVESTNFDTDWEFNDERDNRFDAGLMFGGGASFSIKNKIEVSAEAAYYYGLTDTQKQYMLYMRPHYNSTLAIQASILYNL
ncbi:MAG: PorT family protein [Bacteroidales bacterium]|nr:PorT family protein [Candidatus Colimorpha onthohippi]